VRPPIDLDARGIEDAAVDAQLRQGPGQAESIVAGLVADHDPLTVLRRGAKPRSQFRDIAAGVQATLDSGDDPRDATASDQRRSRGSEADQLAVIS
jgi:hypothetical protein